MTEAGWLAIITAVFGGLGTLLTIWVNYRAGKIINQNQGQLTKMDLQHEQNKTKIDSIESVINGRVAELVAAQVKLEIEEAVKVAVTAALKIEREKP